MPTQAQLTANRANSQLSTGPKTETGKTKISHNAVKNGLTGATVLLPTDDAVLYEQHLASVFAIWAPANHREKLLVQSIADTEWRLQRIPVLESGILALGRMKNVDLFDELPEHLRATLLEAHIHETYARELRNLNLQERRLRNYREKDIAELQTIQKERSKRRAEQLESAARIYERYDENKWNFNPAEFGFEFSLQEIEEKVVGLWDRKRQKQAA